MTDSQRDGSTTEGLVEALRSSRLTVTHDGDDYVLGSPAAGVYVRAGARRRADRRAEPR